MQTTSSIKKNFIMNVILTVSLFLFPLITFPYASRILLPTGMGKVDFASSVLSYFSLVAQLGIPTYGIRACAQVRDDREALTRTARELLLINLIMDALAYAALAIALVLVPRFRADRPLYLVVSLNIILTSIGMEWLYKALEQYSSLAVRAVAVKVVAICAMFLLVHGPEDYVIYGAITTFAASAANVINFICAFRFVDLWPRGGYQPSNKLHLGRHLKPAAIFFAMTCAVTIYTNMDSVMLGFLHTDESVGLYNAAVKVKSILVGVVTSLGTVLLPRMSYYVEKGDRAAFRRMARKAINFVWILAVPLLIFFTLFAGPSILFLSGPAYAGAVVPMQIIMPTLLLIGLSNLTGIQILIPLGMEKQVLTSELAGALVNLIINSLLIPRYAASGAAIGTVAAELVVLLVQLHYVKHEVSLAFRSVSYWKIALATALATAVSVWGMTQADPGQLSQGAGAFRILLLGAALFFGVYTLVLLLTRERMTREIAAQLMGRIKRRKSQ